MSEVNREGKVQLLVNGKVIAEVETFKVFPPSEGQLKAIGIEDIAEFRKQLKEAEEQ